MRINSSLIIHTCSLEAQMYRIQSRTPKKKQLRYRWVTIAWQVLLNPMGHLSACILPQQPQKTSQNRARSSMNHRFRSCATLNYWKPYIIKKLSYFLTSLLFWYPNYPLGLESLLLGVQSTCIFLVQYYIDDSGYFSSVSI